MLIEHSPTPPTRSSTLRPPSVSGDLARWRDGAATVHANEAAATGFAGLPDATGHQKGK